MPRKAKQDILEKFPHLVFHDDACPLCSKEINHYQSLDKCHSIVWAGIHIPSKKY